MTLSVILQARRSSLLYNQNQARPTGTRDFVFNVLSLSSQYNEGAPQAKGEQVGS